MQKLSKWITKGLNVTSYMVQFMGFISCDPVCLALVFGGGVVKSIVNYLNGDLKWLGDGLTVAGALLPAVGFAILLRYLPLKKHYPYFIFGFIITAIMVTLFDGMSGLGTAVAGLDKKFDMTFSSLPMLAIAAIGFAFAALEYKRSSTPRAVSATSNSQNNQNSENVEGEGEIDDDEL